ncbi:TonB-dependent receptor plug domain-containing protein [Hydrogenovibrio marinus]|uniref:TonB-dependent receptor n=1 Tax=Hydrogenovibrio marinus TaxID=28885 RepID=A0A067A0V9_HYDMR|nr:TonB-dependent receptor [Hydrogenovibrio marinus]KDN96226.1 hypothetical protein EI16_08060 [Hydrogenovibrio marinus]BBN60593.1 TonB-dependent receptor [Hydrogenovibrio marinus]
MKTVFKKKLLVAAVSSLMMAPVSNSSAADQLSEIKVSEKDDQKHESRTVQVKDSIVHTDVISAKTIEKKQAGSLEQAIKDEPGVDVRTECSVCGAKRVSLNGLKGEHTTLMINGVPNSSILEGFYGYDAIPMAGVTSVEISRGAGASLIAPEAIGGVINVVTAAPKDDKLSLDLSLGTDGYKKYQVVGTKISKDKRTQMMTGAQTDNIDQYDGDNNGVSESPKLTNHSVVAQIWHQADKDRFEVRLADQRSEMFGGPMVGILAKSESDAKTQAVGTSPGFIGDNINNRPNTAGGATTARDFVENVVTTKQEVTGTWSRDVNAQLTTNLTGSYVKTNTDDIYEGTTYQADQNIYYVDVRADYYPSLQHAITVGTDFKHDKMLSVSTGGTYPANDSYDKKSNGLYVRDIWTPNQRLEVAAAVRMDVIDVNFLEQNRKFNDTIVVPRLHVRYDHNFNWTSRFSAGMGYRVPLQFFEAEHGILDNGFKVAVDKLEKSQSARYELAYSGAKTTMSTSYAWTAVSNLAAIDSDNYTVPTLISTHGTGHVQHADINVSYQLTHDWTLGSSLEGFVYDKTYRKTFSVIPIESRLRLMADYDGHGWQGNLTLTGIGSRKYSDYPTAAYDKHYDDNAMTKSKGTKSPAYFTADVKVSKDISKEWKVYAGVNNLFDYTQIGTGDSPLYYDNTGTKTWDTGHIWGPLRGRVVYGGVRTEF